MENTADVKAIAKVMAQYAEALNKDDVDLYCTIHDVDAEKMPQHRPWIAGAAAIRKFFNGISKNFRWQNAVVHPMEIEVFGGFAYSRGSYSFDMISKADGTIDHTSGKFLTVFKQQPDGSWKIYRDSYLFDTHL